MRRPFLKSDVVSMVSSCVVEGGDSTRRTGGCLRGVRSKGPHEEGRRRAGWVTREGIARLRTGSRLGIAQARFVLGRASGKMLPGPRSTPPPGVDPPARAVSEDTRDSLVNLGRGSDSSFLNPTEEKEA